MDGLERELGSIDSRLGNIESMLEAVVLRYEEHSTAISGIKTNLAVLETKMISFEKPQMTFSSIAGGSVGGGIVFGVIKALSYLGFLK